MIPIEFDMIVFKENETHVAYCPELDISSCGGTVEHAKEMLKTAVRLFVEEAEKYAPNNSYPFKQAEKGI